MELSKVICIGAGPAGLTAAYQLSKNGWPVTVLETDPKYVGGISKTVEYKGFHFDIGGHRFFSKSQKVEDLWTEILPDDFLTRPRLSRIYYKGKFYNYPLKAAEALANLGIWESTKCVLSYAKARLFKVNQPKNFEEWVSNQFGRRLFEIFFKSYTEKVWGMPCNKISADWAAQRIKGLSLGTAVWHAIKPKSKKTDRSKKIKTLIDEFRYPRLGPGMIWETAVKKIEAAGGEVLMGCTVTGLKFDQENHNWEVEYTDGAGKKKTEITKHVISSAAIHDLIPRIEPTPKCSPQAKQLKYRDFLMVALMLKNQESWNDNWIYIHDPEVKVGRIQNFKSWSPDMVPDATSSCYGLEYFCFEGDGLWAKSDAELIDFAAAELEKLGLAQRKDIFDGHVVRQKKAYPVYDHDYETHVAEIRRELAQAYPNLHLVGRNGMHRYNNQDHAMMTAMLTVENIFAGHQIYDVWAVNQDAEYLEEQKNGTSHSTSGLRLTPVPVR